MAERNNEPTGKHNRTKANKIPLNRYQDFFTEFSKRFSAYSGHQEFFHGLAEFLYDLTGVDYVLVGRADSDHEGKFSITTIALMAFGKITDNIVYPMWKGPCYEVVKGTLYSYPKNCRQTFPENRTLSDLAVEGYIGYPLYNAMGDAVGLIALMHQKEIDDCEKKAAILRIVAKRAEFELDRIEYEKAIEKQNAAVRLTKNRLQSTLDGVPAIITLLEVVTDAGGNPVDFVVTATNSALSTLTGIDSKDLIGQKLSGLFPETFGENQGGNLKQDYISVFRTGEPLRREFLQPGTDQWFLIHVSKQVDGNGIVVAALDITDQKQNERQKKENQILSELNAEKTKFFTNISHEFRTPITLMLGPLQDLLQSFNGNPANAMDVTKLHMIIKNTLRLQKLVNTLLDFSSVEAGRSETVFQPTDIAEYTTLLAGSFRSAIEEAGVTYQVKCESTEPVYLNQGMWEKIVLNLISNAFKFTFQGSIEVLLKSFKTKVQLQIKDTGVGIASADRSRIFERFVSIKNTRSRTSEGTGIGLALVKELVKIHKGDIKVKSTEGKGSLFIVSIPKGKAHLPSKSIYELKEGFGASPLSAAYEYEAMTWFRLGREDGATSEDHANNINGQRRQNGAAAKAVLIVDDNADIREYVRGILSSRYRVSCASSGKMAMELIHQGLRPDLVLADIMMPQMDGYALLKALKNETILSDVPVIFLSAKASENARVEGLRRGADDYLVKPFSSVELLARVGAGLRRGTRAGVGGR